MAYQIRNFVIIAHIDHGKSTLADRFLEITKTIESRKMREQVLDRMDLERERGITIKMQPVRMMYKLKIQSEKLKVGSSEIFNFKLFTLNLIDTPGHVDFNYEVSRALAAVEGAILLVDATQGVQAQTIANLHLAQKEKLAIIPVINKIDLPNADREAVAKEVATLLKISPDEILAVSGKTGAGVVELLEAVITKVPPPDLHLGEPTRALIFDSQFDAYKGVIAHIRVVSGSLKGSDKIRMLGAGTIGEIVEVGRFNPDREETASLGAGEIGYVATGLKEAGVRVGDTIILEREFGLGPRPLAEYLEPTPVVFASLYPASADNFPQLKDSLDKLKLNDAALSYEMEASEALGRGFRVGFLGMLHLEIISERLRREFGREIIVSTPSVSYRLQLRSGATLMVYAAADIPDEGEVLSIAEPWVRLEIIAPSEHLGRILKLLETTRARYIDTTYLSALRLLLVYRIPLKEIIVDFYDRLKSVTSGYASMGYEFYGYETGELVRLDVLIAERRERAFSTVVHVSEAYNEGRRIVARLKELLPAQVFALSLQAAIGGRVLARETIPALRKNVTGHLYGGDRTRKMKLWQKQKKGKKRLAALGRGAVEIPPDVFLKMLKR